MLVSANQIAWGLGVGRWCEGGGNSDKIKIYDDKNT